MSCGNCNCGYNKLESTSVIVTAGVMQITVIPLQAYSDYKFYQLELCQSLPARTGVEPVSVSDGVNSYPVMDTNGQPVVSGKLRGHRKYRVRFGSGGTLSSGSIPPHFTIYDGLCAMEYSSNAALQSPPIGG